MGPPSKVHMFIVTPVGHIRPMGLLARIRHYERLGMFIILLLMAPRTLHITFVLLREDVVFGALRLEDPFIPYTLITHCTKKGKWLPVGFSNALLICTVESFDKCITITSSSSSNMILVVSVSS